MTVARNRCAIAIAAALLTMIVALSCTASASAFAKAIWGQPYVNGVNQFPTYQKLGVKIVEADLNWYLVAPKRPNDAANPNDPAYRWPAEVQRLVDQAKRYHMKVMLQIIGSPKWSNGGHAWNWAPRARAYATFAAAAAHRYRSVHLWMVWGEPSRKPNWEPETAAKPGQPLDAAQKVAPHRYAEVLDAAYGALKAVSPKNLVIGGSTYTTGNIDTQQWIENLKLPDGEPPRVDIWAHNPFSWQPPAFSSTFSADGVVQFKDLHELAGWIDKYLHKKLPIFLSEWTVPSAPDQEFGFWVDERTGARWVTTALRESRRWDRIWGLGWIHVYDDPPVSYGGLMSANGTPKPVFYAFQHG